MFSCRIPLLVYYINSFGFIIIVLIYEIPQN